MLRYAALCCTIAMLRCAALCCLMLHYAALCCAMRRGNGAPILRRLKFFLPDLLLHARWLCSEIGISMCRLLPGLFVTDVRDSLVEQGSHCRLVALYSTLYCVHRNGVHVRCENVQQAGGKCFRKLYRLLLSFLSLSNLSYRLCLVYSPAAIRVPAGVRRGCTCTRAVAISF
jgi:hypothetical protein